MKKSLLSRGVRVHTGAVVEGSVLMDDCDIGRHAKVRHAILDKKSILPKGGVSYDLDADRAHGWHMALIVVIGREYSAVPMAAIFT